MKLITLFITIACLQVSAASFAQRVTLSEKNAPLSEVFNKIQRQSGYQFFYKGDLLGNVKVSVEVKDVTVQQAMDVTLKDLPLTYTVTNNIIVIKHKSEPVPEKQISSIPPANISGQIINKQKEPLVGATVLLKRTKTGTQTDVKGNFLLQNILQTDTLIISYIGYKTRYVSVGAQSVFTIVMEETTNALDQVQIQAYGTTTQRLATGNIATVTAAEIQRYPVMNVLEALEGKVPGLVVTPTNGYASAPFKVEIRGRSGINPDLPSEPLYIIDGVPITTLNIGGNQGNYKTGSKGVTQNGFIGPAGGQSPLFNINPEDIENVSVLIDADATAIYGSRGANGVILITTKKGKPGKTRLEASAYQGFSKVTNYYNLLNTQQYIAMRQEAFKNDNIVPTVNNAYDLLLWNTNNYTDWQKFDWGGTGHVTDANASISGGDQQTTFRVSGTFHRQTNIMTISGADQIGDVQFNLTHKSLDQKLTTTFSSLYSYTQSNLTSVPANWAGIPPDAPSVFDAQGNLNFAGWGSYNTPAANKFTPFAALLQPYTAKTGLLNSRLNINYQLLKGLVLSTSLGYSTTHQSAQQLTPIASQNPASNPTGSSLFGNNNNTSSIIEPQLEYSALLGKGKFNALLGGTVQSTSGDGNTLRGIGFTNDNLLQSVLNAPTTTGTNVSGQYKYSAIFARINYNWEDKYLLNISARRDGSSRFGPGNQFGNFWSVGAGWIFTQENWFKNNFPLLSFGKLRGSYGITGSDQIGDYQFLSQWSSNGMFPYQAGVPVYTSTILPNPDLQWQVNKKLEASLNLGFFQDRLTTEVTWYQNRCGNQLISFLLPVITGFTGVTANSPALVQNTGWEFRLNGIIVDQKDFTWSANFNIGFNKNKLVSYPNLAQSPYAAYYTVGESLNIARLIHYTGVDPQTGQYTFQDKNHDGQILNSGSYTDGHADTYNTDMSVKTNGGFGTDLRYKDWQINLFFQFKKQLLPSSIYGFVPGSIAQQSIQVLNHWQKSGDAAQFPRYSTTSLLSSNLFSQYSDGIYSDGSYIRLKNLSLSYSLKGQWVKAIGVQSCKLFIRGENIFILTKYNGIDPDAPNFGQLPPIKTFIAGLQFNL